MGAHSTISVTRSKALELYLGRALDGITNEELEKFLEFHLDQYLYNVNIVPDDYEFEQYEINGNITADNLINRR